VVEEGTVSCRIYLGTKPRTLAAEIVRDCNIVVPPYAISVGGRSSCGVLCGGTVTRNSTFSDGRNEAGASAVFCLPEFLCLHYFSAFCWRTKLGHYLRAAITDFGQLSLLSRADNDGTLGEFIQHPIYDLPS